MVSKSEEGNQQFGLFGFSGYSIHSVSTREPHCDFYVFIFVGGSKHRLLLTKLIVFGHVVVYELRIIKNN